MSGDRCFLLISYQESDVLAACYSMTALLRAYNRVLQFATIVLLPSSAASISCKSRVRKEFGFVFGNFAKKTPNWGSSRAHDQNRIIGMAHDRLGHAAEHPALHAGAAMRAHSDQRIGGFPRRCDNFVCFKTLFSCE